MREVFDIEIVWTSGLAGTYSIKFWHKFADWKLCLFLVCHTLISWDDEVIHFRDCFLNRLLWVELNETITPWVKVWVNRNFGRVDFAKLLEGFVEVIMLPVFWETFHEELSVLALELLVKRAGNRLTWVLLVERQDSDSYATNVWVLELINSFLGVI